MINNLGTKFINIASRKKNNKAIILNNESRTFHSLNLESDKICLWLLKKNFSTSDLVCISSEKSFFNFSLIIALLKLGNTYVVLDLDSPIKRINQIIYQVKPKAIFLVKKNSIKIKYKNIFFKKDVDF